MKACTLIILFCSVFNAITLMAQNATENSKFSTENNKTIIDDSLSFPDSWLGYWEGELEIFKDNKKVQAIPMALELLEMDNSQNLVWAIIYGEDAKSGRRPYELETLDAEKGYFLVDEKNTIKLETYLYRNKLLSWYEVMGNLILCIYEKQGDHLIFEIIFGSSEPVSITGNQEVDGEAIPAVKTFPIGGYQKAVLKKKS